MFVEIVVQIIRMKFRVQTFGESQVHLKTGVRLTCGFKMAADDAEVNKQVCSPHLLHLFPHISERLLTWLPLLSKRQRRKWMKFLPRFERFMCSPN